MATQITQEEQLFRDVFEATGAKVTAFYTSLYGGKTIYTVEIQDTMLSIGSNQIGRLGAKGYSVFEFAVAPRGNRQVFVIGFLDTTEFIETSADIARGCGDL